MTISDNGEQHTGAPDDALRFSLTSGTWRHFTMLDGLVHNVVLCLYTDDEGYLWVGTEGGGISRFDGAAFFNLTESQGLAGSNVKAIHRDPDGTLWVGTWGTGLSRYDGEQFTNFNTSNGLPGDKVWAIHRDSRGRLWLGTDGGICRVDGEHFTRLEDDIPIGPDVLSISEAADGTLYFGRGSLRGGGGLSIWDGERLHSTIVGDGSGPYSVMAVYAESRERVWLGTGSIARGSDAGHILRYDGTQITEVGAECGLGGVNVRAITPDPAGRLWFSTWRGAWFFDGKCFQQFAPSQDVPGQYVNAIHCGRDGAFWFGVGNLIDVQGRLLRYEPDVFRRWKSQPHGKAQRIHTSHEDADGTLWLGTSEGALCIQRDKPPRLIEIGEVYDIHRAQDGCLWMATWSNGIVRYAPEQLAAMGPIASAPGNAQIHSPPDGTVPDVLCIYEDEDGTLWFGTLGGLVRYRNGEFALMDWVPPWYTRLVSCVYRDRHGTLWVGSASGLYRREADEARSLMQEDGAPFRFVCHIHEDSDGVLWFGSYGGGVVRYDGSQCTRFTMDEGLPSNHILFITRDSRGTLWVGTDGGGVAVYDGVSWSALDTRDGLSGNHVFCMFEREGALWFGTDEGLTLYRRNHSTPIARLLSVTSGERHTDLQDLPRFAAGARITFEYTSIDFKTHPAKRLYRYKLAGYDADWRAPTRATQADYAALPAGEYRFLVQAIDRDLNYSEAAEVRIHVAADPRDLQIVSLQAELQQLQWEVGSKYQFANIVGRSAPIKEVYRLMEKAIESPLPVLITGETGTGKDLIAKAIHYNSPRKAGPLKELNCGAIPRDLVASTLFGYRRGTYTGAQEDRPGVFEEASGGTVLLDEIGEMPEDAQVHLLRVLQERKTQRLGETRLREIDVRVIAITNRDLASDVRTGRFREDLFYRLNVFPIPVPPLRARVDDIPLLMEHFLEKACRKMGKNLNGFGPGVFEMFQQYSWPGNVRELENEISRAVSLVEEGLKLHTYHFSSHLTQGESLYRDLRAESLSFAERTELFQRRMIEEALRDAAGNRSEAARELGMHRPNLLRLMKRLGIES